MFSWGSGAEPCKNDPISMGNMTVPFIPWAYGLEEGGPIMVTLEGSAQVSVQQQCGR